MTTEKPKDECLKESLEILRNIQTLGIPYNSPEVQELKSRLDAYINDGIPWCGTISFRRFGRIAEVNLPRRADKPIEVRLRVPRAGK